MFKKTTHVISGCLLSKYGFNSEWWYLGGGNFVAIYTALRKHFVFQLLKQWHNLKVFLLLLSKIRDWERTRNGFQSKWKRYCIERHGQGQGISISIVLSSSVNNSNVP